MRITSSGQERRFPLVGNEDRALRTSAQPVVVGEFGLFALALVRLFCGLLWFQQLFWKLPPSFSGLHNYVVEEGKYTFIPGYAFIIQHVFLPNFILLGAFTWIAELVVAITLLFGLFSRFGGLVSLLLSLQLYVGLAVAPGEWYWTYGMLVLLSIALIALPTGRRLGIDQWLVMRLQNAATTRRFARIASWFV